MTPSQQERETRALKRLIIAHITFQQVIAGCDFLITHESDEYAQFYGTFLTGICVAYMRPYVSSARLGPLPREYSTFPADTPHARTHDSLRNGRNWVHAHYSPDEASVLLTDEKQREEQKKIRFIFQPDGIMFCPPEVTWPKSRLHAIVSLCEFQIQRIKVDVHSRIERLGDGKVYRYGEYIIGETFP